MINTHFFPHVVSLPPTPSVTDIAPAKSVKVRWPELMGITTLAEYLDMSEASVRKLIDERLLPPATTAPSPRLKRWKRSVVDERLQRLADQGHSRGKSMDSVLAGRIAANRGGR